MGFLALVIVNTEIPAAYNVSQADACNVCVV